MQAVKEQKSHSLNKLAELYLHNLSDISRNTFTPAAASAARRSAESDALPIVARILVARATSRIAVTAKLTLNDGSPQWPFDNDQVMTTR